MILRRAVGIGFLVFAGFLAGGITATQLVDGWWVIFAAQVGGSIVGVTLWILLIQYGDGYQRGNAPRRGTFAGRLAAFALGPAPDTPNWGYQAQSKHIEASYTLVGPQCKVQGPNGHQNAPLDQSHGYARLAVVARGAYCQHSPS